MKRWIIAALALVVAGGGAVFPQSLAELARKEKERRSKNAAGPVASFSDEDLRRAGPPLAEGDVAEAPADEADEGESEEPEREDPRRTREHWQRRLRAIDARIAAIESRLNRPGFDQDIRGYFERQRLERELAEAREEREALFEEARKAGVPPGWLR